MMTIRQIERHWQAKSYPRLVRELLARRPEASARLEVELEQALPAAALALIRLDELGQSHAFLCTQLLRNLLEGQESDGGWGDPMTTALCLRALMCARGTGLAVERGLHYLAALQKAEGIWPRVPIRRTPADPFVSAFILYQLGDNRQFRGAGRFRDAVNWFERNDSVLDAQTRHLWDRAAFRCRMGAIRAQAAPLWS